MILASGAPFSGWCCGPVRPPSCPLATDGMGAHCDHSAEPAAAGSLGRFSHHCPLSRLETAVVCGLVTAHLIQGGCLKSTQFSEGAIGGFFSGVVGA